MVITQDQKAAKRWRAGAPGAGLRGTALTQQRATPRNHSLVNTASFIAKNQIKSARNNFQSLAKRFLEKQNLIEELLG